MTNVVPIQKPAKTTEIKVTVELPAEATALVNKFVAINQHSQNSHGPMTMDKLVTLLLEDVAAGVRDGDTWQGCHMMLVLTQHGYRMG
jgi:hypothetical protein